MKVFVVKNNGTKLGYELVIEHDDGSTETKQMLGVDPKNENILHLPENPSNRQWLSVNKLNGLDSLELKYKETRTLSKSSSDTPRTRKSDIDYLSEEDKVLYEELMARAKKNRQEAENNLSDSEFEQLVEKLLFQDIDSRTETSIIKRIIKSGRKQQLVDLINK